MTSRADDDAVGTETAAPVTATATRTSGPNGEDLAGIGPERTGGAPVPTEPPPVVATDTPETTPTPPDTSAAPARNSADVVLSFAGWNESSAAMEAGGYVTVLLEDGGICTLTLTADDRVRTVSGDAIRDATTVSCGTLQITGDQLGSGSWEAVLSYESSSTVGQSAPMKVQVP